MINKEILKKQIIYRSTHRGSKEMDLLLGTFVKKNIDLFTDIELKDLENLLKTEDEILEKWYFVVLKTTISHKKRCVFLVKRYSLTHDYKYR